MIKNSFLLIGLLALFSIVAGCASLDKELCRAPNTFCPGTGRLEMDYGTSYKLAKFNQTLNPDAEKNLQPVTGFDGPAAKNTLDKYQKDFEKPAPPPTYVLGVGTIGK